MLQIVHNSLNFCPVRMRTEEGLKFLALLVAVDRVQVRVLIRVVARLHNMLDVVATVKVAAKAYKDSVETQRKSVMAESAKMAQTVEVHLVL